MFGLNPYSIALKIGIALVVAALAAFTTHKIDHGAYADLELKYAKAQQEQIEAGVRQLQHDTKITEEAAVAEAKVQQQIVVQTLTLTREVTRYVKDTSTCVTFGLVRVLDAAALGVDPADLPLPAGQSDDACAPVTASALAGSVATNYGTARQNAEQLNRLEATVLELLPPQAQSPGSPGHATRP